MKPICIAFLLFALAATGCVTEVREGPREGRASRMYRGDLALILPRQPVTAQSGAILLESRIREETEVVFIPWNGKQREDGSSCTFRFRQGAAIRFEFVGSDIRDYVGSFSFLSGSSIEAKIKSDIYPYPYMAWPRMLLRRDGEDLLLYREDGITWWHDLYPKDGSASRRDTWPFYPESLEGFWPLRASKKMKTQQGGASNRAKPGVKLSSSPKE